MKSWKWLTIGLMVAAILALGTGFAFAQDPDQPAPPAGPGYGPMGMWGNSGAGGLNRAQGMMGQGMMGQGLMGQGWILEVVAEKLGLTVEDLWAELATGSSIAQLAEDKGVDVQDILDELVADHEASLSEAVAAGTITAEQAEWMNQHFAAMIAGRLNQSWFMQGNGGWGGRGQGGGFGRSGGGCHGGYGFANPNVTPSGA